MDRTLKRATFVMVAALIGAAVLFGFLGAWSKGYRLNGLSLTPPVTVILSHIPEYALVHVDGTEIPVANDETEIEIPLTEGTHRIVVSKIGFYPWEKEVALQSGEIVRLNTFLMPESPSGTPILEKTPERKTLEALFASNTLPTREHPALSPDGTTALFAEEGTIIARWLSEEARPHYFCTGDVCEDEHVVLSYEAELRDLAFYPGRSDMALLAIQNGIFALELDNRGTQNFQPVYRGTRPRLLLAEDVAYLKEGQGLIRLDLK